jgi:CoA-transferase family III
LFDTTLHQMSYPATWYLNEAVEGGGLPRGAYPSIAPSQLFKTADGWLMLMCQTPKFWYIFCMQTDPAGLLVDGRFATDLARCKNLVTLTMVFDAHSMMQNTVHWIELLGGHVRAIGMTHTVDHPDAKGEKFGMLAGPIKVNGKRAIGKRAPRLGEMDNQPRLATSASTR